MTALSKVAVQNVRIGTELTGRFARNRPFRILIFSVFKVRYTPNSGHSANIDLNYRFVPEADIAGPVARKIPKSTKIMTLSTIGNVTYCFVVIKRNSTYTQFSTPTRQS